MRFLSALLGLLLTAGVIWLGMLSGSNPAYVVPFGIASALGAPFGFALLAFAFKGRRDDTVLNDLRKIPEIDRLINEAKSKEEQLRLLEAERARLHEIIVTESRRQTLLARKAAAEEEARRLLDEISALDAEMEQFVSMDDTGKISSVSIDRLRSQVSARKNRDIVIPLPNRTLILPKELFLSIPMGSFIYNYLRLFQYMMDSVRNDIKRRKNTKAE